MQATPVQEIPVKHWKPHPGPQTDFLLAQEYEVGYGGARGGGKTEAGIAVLLYDVAHPLLRVLVIRRNAEDMNDWVDRAKRFYLPLGAIYTDRTFTWPSGAIFRLGHLKDEDAYTKYQGHEYHKMLIEELTQIPSEVSYLKLISSCRSTIKELRPQVYSNFNPDGPGFSWVKKRFGLEGIPTAPIRMRDAVTGLSRVFIPARLSDNPTLARDPLYKAFLDGLPDGLRQAWRDGSWSEPIIQGAFYTMELSQMVRERRYRPVAHDSALLVHTIWDLGVHDATSILFVQRTAMETRIINYYQNNNFGLQHYAAQLEILQREHGYRYGSHFLPHDATQREKSTGKTYADLAREMHLSPTIIPRVGIEDGIIRVRVMLPRIWMDSNNCPTLMDALRNYRREWDEKLLKYKDVALHDWASHPADALRYLAVVEGQLTNEPGMVGSSRETVVTLDPRMIDPYS